MSATVYLLTAESSFELPKERVAIVARALLVDEEFMEWVEGEWDEEADPVELFEACLGAMNLKPLFHGDDEAGDVLGLEHVDVEVPSDHWEWVQSVMAKHFLPHVVPGSFLRLYHEASDLVEDWVFEDDGHCGYLWGEPEPVLRIYDVKHVRAPGAVEEYHADEAAAVRLCR